jgi:uncharacterized OB-fold protein
MFRDPVIGFKNQTHIQCKHCGHKQLRPQTTDPVWFIADQNYLDDGLVELQQKYFAEKYTICENCGNIYQTEDEDNFEIINTEDVQLVLHSNKSQIEKIFTIMYIVRKSFETTKDLYYLYMFLENKKAEQYFRNQLIRLYSDRFIKHQDIISLRMLIELYRRNGDFDRTLVFIENDFVKLKSLSDETIRTADSQEYAHIEKEKELCKSKNSDRVLKYE